MPEDSSQTLSALDATTLDQLRRHGVLRSLLSGVVKQELLHDVELEQEALRKNAETFVVACAQQLQERYTARIATKEA